MAITDSKYLSFPTRLDWHNTILSLTALLAVIVNIIMHNAKEHPIYILSVVPFIIYCMKSGILSYKLCPIGSFKDSSKSERSLCTVLFLFVNLYSCLAVIKNGWFLFLSFPLSGTFLLIGNPFIHDLFSNDTKQTSDTTTNKTETKPIEVEKNEKGEEYVALNTEDTSIGFIMGLLGIIPNKREKKITTHNGVTTYQGTNGLKITLDKNKVTITIDNNDNTITLSYPSLKAIESDTAIFKAIKETIKQA